MRNKRAFSAQSAADAKKSHHPGRAVAFIVFAVGRLAIQLRGQGIQGLFPAQFICLCYGRDDVREDELFAKFLYKAYFGKVCQYVVIYTAKD